MEEFISEPIQPERGTFDTAAMGRGLPGLPRGFIWRGTSCGAAELVDQWKQSATEGGRVGGERYLRRHYYRIRMGDGSIWTVYFTRQPGPGTSPRLRWFLYSRVAP